MAILDFNYSRAINQAKQIDDIANEMLSVASTRLQNSLDSIGACWKGESSQQFIGYCAGVQTDIRNQSRNLQNVARRIRDAAKIIRDAEMRAKELQRKEAAASSSGSGSGGGGGGTY